MRLHLLILGFCALLVFKGCQVAESQRKSSTRNGLPTTQHSPILEIGGEAAVALVRQDILNAHRSPEKYDFAICEPPELWAWRVVAEPKESISNKELLEYAILKPAGGRISGKKVLSLKYTFNSVGQIPKTSTKIGKEAAVATARRDAMAAYRSLRDMKLIVCELPSVWRIVYIQKDDIIGGGPQYVIDKQTGEIVHKVYSQ